MDPVTVGAILSIANGTITLARAAGVIRDERLELAKDTDKMVRSLIEKDFDLAQSKLVTASSTDDARRQTELLIDARRAFEQAEVNSSLPTDARAFSAAMCGALTLRLSGDHAEARRWVEAALMHYDQTFRRVDNFARKAVQARQDVERWAPWAGVPLGPAGAALGFPVLRRRAAQAEAKVFAPRRLAQVNEHALSCQAMARTVGYVPGNIALGLTIRRSAKKGHIKGTSLRLSEAK